MSTNQRFFLGGTSPTGFQSKFSAQIQKSDYYTYILKGGPGIGKSSLIEKINKEFSNKNTELFYSSDNETLDAVVINDLNTIVADGTHPHLFDPIYPEVAQEIINLGEYVNCTNLHNFQKEIIEYTDEEIKYSSRTKRYVRAFASLNSNIYSIAFNSIIFDKLNSFIERLIQKLFPKNHRKSGNVEYKQLSALTDKGYITQPIPPNYAIYALNDDYFAGSDFFLKSLSDIAISKGFNVIISECYMLMNNSIEHLLIPELNLAFISCSFFNGLSPEAYKIINFNRFYNKESLAAKKQKMSFDKKASLELASEASSTILTTHEIHNKLKNYYIQECDYSGIENLTAKIINKITHK